MPQNIKELAERYTQALLAYNIVGVARGPAADRKRAYNDMCLAHDLLQSACLREAEAALNLTSN